MKINVSCASFICVFISSIVTSASLLAAQSRIEFLGSVTANNCVLATDSLNMNVQLGEVSVRDLHNSVGSMGEAQAPFVIRLVECHPGLQSITVKIDDAHYPGSDSRDYLTSVEGEGGARGVGVRIHHADVSEPLRMGREIRLESRLQVIAGDAEVGALPEQSFPFTAYLSKIDSEELVPGMVRAAAIVMIKPSNTVSP